MTKEVVGSIVLNLISMLCNNNMTTRKKKLRFSVYG